jgi:type IV pilus assembly protein PilA
MTHKGFTLIELMIVVAIIGILAAIAIPQYQNYVARAQVSEALVLMSGAKTGVAEHYMTTGSFPDDNEAAGLATTITGNYVDSVEVSPSGDNGVITVAFSDDAHSKLHDGEMTLTAVDTGGSIGFACSSSGSKDISAYLPSSCIDLTGTPIVGSGSVWSSLSFDQKAANFACWNATNNRWEVGTNGKSITNGGQQQLLRDKADDPSSPSSICFPAAKPCNCE